MAQTIKITNYASTNLLQETSLETDAPSGSTSLVVENSAGFLANDYFLAGEPAAENTELLVVQTVTDPVQIAPVTSTILDHTANDKITKLFGSKIRIYRAANVNGIQPADTDFTVLDTVSMTIDQSFTAYTDPIGGAAYWYKFTYYNDNSDTETALSDSTAVRGGSVGNYCSVDDIREEAGFQKARFITDSQIDVYRQSAQAEINGALVGIYTLPFTDPINPLIRDITRRLAAGRLLVKQYGAYGGDNSNRGMELINSVTNDAHTGDLDKLVSRALSLTDATGVSSVLDEANTFAAWPNNTTASADPQNGGSERNFRMSDVSDLSSRKY